MNKEKLLKFLDLYNLNGSIEAVNIVSDGTTLKTSFVAEDKTLAGNVTFNGAGLEECELPVFETSKLKNFIKTLESELTITVNTIGADKKPVNLVVADTKDSYEFMLADESVIPKSPGVKPIKSYDIEIPIDSKFIDSFVKGKGVLPDVDSFTLMMNKAGDKMELIIGWASINSNRFKMSITPTVGKDKIDKPLSFNANYFKEILLKNQDVKGAVFKVNAAGISSLSFITPEFESNYYLVKKDIEG